MNRLTSIAFSALLAFAIGGCAADTGYESASVIRACGPVGEPRLIVKLDDGASCGSATTGLRIVADFFPHSMDAPGEITLSADNRVSRCDESGCVGVTSGTLDILEVDGETRVLTWSLTLEDGSVDEGTVDAHFCGAMPCI